MYCCYISYVITKNIVPKSAWKNWGSFLDTDWRHNVFFLIDAKALSGLELSFDNASVIFN